MLFPFLIRMKDFGINGFSEVNSKRIQEFKTCFYENRIGEPS